MEEITIKFRDNTERKFKEVGRAGGSYSLACKYEGQFVIITDEYYNTTAFPMDLIKEVITSSTVRGRW